MEIYCLKLGSCNYKAVQQDRRRANKFLSVPKEKKGRKTLRVQQVKLDPICQTSTLADRLIYRAVKSFSFYLSCVENSDWFCGFEVFGFDWIFLFHKVSNSLEFCWFNLRHKLSSFLWATKKIYEWFVKEKLKRNWNNKKLWKKFLDKSLNFSTEKAFLFMPKTRYNAHAWSRNLPTPTQLFFWNIFRFVKRQKFINGPRSFIWILINNFNRKVCFEMNEIKGKVFVLNYDQLLNARSSRCSTESWRLIIHKVASIPSDAQGIISAQRFQFRFTSER